MKCCTSKVLQEIIVLILIFKMRPQTTKSIKKFLKSCIAKVARSENMKCSGVRLEVSGSRVAGVWGRERVIEHCYVHRRRQCGSEAFGNILLHFSNFRFFVPISACSPLRLLKFSIPASKHNCS